ncbi:MAG: RDD family protein [Planctomycetes bacterium]|nr:RDD family protein [Planctomycetota bacterium]
MGDAELRQEEAAPTGRPFRRHYAHDDPRPQTAYAGFGRRMAAALLDQVIVSAGALLLTWLIIGTISYFSEGTVSVYFLYLSGLSPGTSLIIIVCVSNLVIRWLYFADMESSPAQATAGKMALGIIVTDMYGRRISFAKASGRYFGKILSVLLLCIGLFMASFTEKRQTLHDMMASCLVIVKPKVAHTDQSPRLGAHGRPPQEAR